MSIINKKNICLEYIEKRIPKANITTRQTKNGLFIYNKSIKDIEIFTYISKDEYNIMGITNLLDSFIDSSIVWGCN